MTVLDALLKLMVEKNASDLYLSVGFPPSMKIDGKMVPVHSEPLNSSMSVSLAKEILGDQESVQNFLQEKEVNMAISRTGVGRFRVNGFFQRNEIAFVIRSIKTQIPSLDDLQLPEALKSLAMSARGLILFVGSTGSGKSTSLAAMIQHRNQTSAGHILTIEDPIEYLHRNQMSLVNQREVGLDTKSYKEALENALREAPDVILIGEIRSMDTMEHAIAYAETGHLCLSTLHANNANQAIDRIINFFPSERRQQTLMDLSLNIRAIISQRLLPKKGGGRIAAVEILINTPTISDLIYRGEIQSLKETMKNPNEISMRTFDQDLVRLYMEGLVEYDDAIRAADSQNDLRLAIRTECQKRGLPDPGSASSSKESWSIE